MDKCREEFENFARWYALPLDKSQDGVYLALETQSAWVACQSWQAKVDELQNLYTQQGINMLKLQKRVDDLELQLANWKQKSMPAMINGICKSCGKEPWQRIISDKEGYALLHCFGCGANKYELIGEQALKGDQYEDHRKNSEDAISNGASLTNHRIEL